jgi:carnitine O-acetyltransferase
MADLWRAPVRAWRCRACKYVTRLPVATCRPSPCLAVSPETDLLSNLAPQTDEEHAKTKLAAERFLADPAQGPRLQDALIAYDREHDSYIEEFWYESYLGQTESVRRRGEQVSAGRLWGPMAARCRDLADTLPPCCCACIALPHQVVLSLNPFFILSQSPTPTPPPPPPSSSTTGPSTATLVPPNHVQLTRASSLILSSLSFIHDLRTGQLAPDVLRGGKPLDMSQYERLFGTARVPRGKGGCEMKTDSTSRHVVVIRRGQICASRWLVPVWRSARLTLSPR